MPIIFGVMWYIFIGIVVMFYAIKYYKDEATFKNISYENGQAIIFAIIAWPVLFCLMGSEIFPKYISEIVSKILTYSNNKDVEK
jgi:hypothetical protein